MGVRNLYACIALADPEDEYLTLDSPRFHAHMGYAVVGRFHRCASKFGRWYDMVWMEKHIGGHGDDPEAVVPYRAGFIKMDRRGRRGSLHNSSIHDMQRS